GRVTTLSHDVIVEVETSNAHDGMLGKHYQALLVLGDTAVDVVSTAPVCEHFRCSRPGKKNEANKGKQDGKAPHPAGHPFFPEDVDDQHDEQGERHRAELRH